MSTWWEAAEAETEGEGSEAAGGEKVSTEASELEAILSRPSKGGGEAVVWGAAKELEEQDIETEEWAALSSNVQAKTERIIYH